MPIPLANFPIASHSDVTTLNAAGLKTDYELLQHIDRFSDRLPADAHWESIRELVAAASLASLEGIGAKGASLLVRGADVWTVRQLAAQEPRTLVERLRTYSESVEWSRRAPTIGDVERMVWLARAATGIRIRTERTFVADVEALKKRERKHTHPTTWILSAFVAVTITVAWFVVFGRPALACRALRPTGPVPLEVVSLFLNCDLMSQVHLMFLEVLGAMLACAMTCIAIISWPVDWLQTLTRRIIIRSLDSEIMFLRIERRAQAIRGKGVWPLLLTFVIVVVLLGIGSLLMGTTEEAVLRWVPLFILTFVLVGNGSWQWAVLAERRSRVVDWETAEAVYLANVINAVLPTIVLVLYLGVLAPASLTWLEAHSAAPRFREARARIEARYDDGMQLAARMTPPDSTRLTKALELVRASSLKRSTSLEGVLSETKREVVDRLFAGLAGAMLIAMCAGAFLPLIVNRPVAFIVWFVVALVGSWLDISLISRWLSATLRLPPSEPITALVAVGALVTISSMLDTLRRR